mmetsp:Transcript_24627/g.58589  ORF Transcript_24627/g.58589 Transcript_24627/m.58589 type:complete len:222 (-) Transcript_24627:1150-1815(-)
MCVVHLEETDKRRQDRVLGVEERLRALSRERSHVCDDLRGDYPYILHLPRGAKAIEVSGVGQAAEPAPLHGHRARAYEAGAHLERGPGAAPPEGAAPPRTGRAPRAAQRGVAARLSRPIPRLGPETREKLSQADIRALLEHYGASPAKAPAARDTLPDGSLPTADDTESLGGRSGGNSHRVDLVGSDASPAGLQHHLQAAAYAAPGPSKLGRDRRRSGDET